MSDAQDMHPNFPSSFVQDGALEHYSSLAVDALDPIAPQLFQLRKVGITIHVPEAVRKAMLEKSGQSAARLLALIDGRLNDH
ncbi:hypothetical protein [Burkholderia sp. Tr-20390]|uniref:hypothetical protein n=1 Tax=Burkholderia sp. Tr-20390 TaxID=2703904 RepID=UPI001981FC3A|nr:hypothetical protein [Burkholderia sp. Tr-20390]MBN3729503.1 hypothetical protein [Burkholderia sp. Tr-20390]